MTKPTVVFFGYDAVPVQTPKIFVRALLYSSSAQGQVLEAMYARLRHGDDEELFTFWGYGEASILSVGSGLFVPRTGYAANHHFVLSVHRQGFAFAQGTYRVEILGRIVGKARPRLLAAIDIDVSDRLAGGLAQGEGVLFERMPDGEYEGHLRDRP